MKAIQHVLVIDRNCHIVKYMRCSSRHSRVRFLRSALGCWRDATEPPQYSYPHPHPLFARPPKAVEKAAKATARAKEKAAKAVAKAAAKQAAKEAKAMAKAEAKKVAKEAKRGGRQGRQ